MSFTESQNQPPQVAETEQAGPAYLEMLNLLRYAETRFRDNPHERLKQQYTAYERFLLAQEHQGAPWLNGQYQGEPILNQQMCLHTDLPKTWKQDCAHMVDKAHSFASIPFLPAGQTLFDSPESTWQPRTKLEILLRQIVESICIDQLYYHKQLDPQIDQVLNQNENETLGMSRMRIARKYLSWAFGTAVRGADVLKANGCVGELSEMLQNGAIITGGRAVKGENQALISDYEEMRFALERLETDLVRSEYDMVGDIDHGRHTSESNETAVFLSNNFLRIINLARWRAEHFGMNDEAKTLLERAYFGLMRVQSFHYVHHGNMQQLAFTRNIASLTVGARPDRYHPQAEFGSLGTADYFDAFMAIAASYSVTEYMKTGVGNNQFLGREQNGSNRSFFGTHMLPSESPKQLLATLTVLCLRMPQWQRDMYAEIISKILHNLLDIINKIDEDEEEHHSEPLLYIANSPAHKNSYYPFDFSNHIEATRYLHLNPTQYFASEPGSIYNHMVHRQTGRLEAVLPPDSQLIGYGADELTIDSNGFVVTKKELAQKSKRRELTRHTAESENWLIRLSRAPEVLSRRLGEEVALRIREMLERDESTGSIKSIAKLTGLLEKLLGKKLPEQSTDFIDFLMELGLLNTELFDVSEVTESDIREIIRRCQKDKPELQDLDVTTGLIFLFAATNQIPRELLVELMYKSFDSLEKLVVVEAISVIEELDQSKLAFLFGRKEKKSVILRWRDELTAITQAGRAASPESYSPSNDQKFAEKAQELINEVTKLIHRNRSYDISMSSTIMAVLTGKEQKRLVTRCAVDGQLLTAILRLISPELITYYTETYGHETEMELDDWYNWLEHADESGGSSHGFNQSEFLPTQAMTTQVSDVTGGFSYLLQASQVEPLPEITAIMQKGKATRNHLALFKPQTVRGHCVKRGDGSSLICDLALEADQVLHAENADPDDNRVLMSLAFDPDQPDSIRLAALDKCLHIEPRRLAFGLRADYAVSHAASRLERTISFGQLHHRWGAVLLACNIMRHAGFFPEEYRQRGETLYQQFVTDLGTHPEEKINEILQATPWLFSQNDQFAIHEARRNFEAEVAKKAESLPTEQHHEVARMHQVEVRQSCQIVIDHEIESAQQIAAEMHMQEQLAKQARETIPFGEFASNQHRATLADRTQALTEATSLGTTVNESALFLETIKPEVGQKALKLLTSDTSGKQLTGEALQQRVQRLHALIAKTGLELANRQISASTGVADALLAENPQTAAELEQTAMRHAELLVSGLEANATAIGLSLPKFEFHAVNIHALPDTSQSRQQRQLPTGS